MKTPEQVKQQMTQATEAAANLAKQSQEFAETTRAQLESAKWFVKELFKGVGPMVQQHRQRPPRTQPTQ